MADHLHRQPAIIPLYEEYLAHKDTTNFVTRVSKLYMTASLERLTASHHRLARRASVLVLGVLGDYEANPVLGRALIDKDRNVRVLAEDGIKEIWQRAGTSLQRAELQIIMRLNSDGMHAEAARRASTLIEQAPWFAEAWNQRAIAYFSGERYADSIRDCRQALEINPYHFGAAAGIGRCQVRLDKPAAALEAYRRALRLNPNLEVVRAEVIRLQKAMKDR